MYSSIDDLVQWVINLDHPKVGGQVLLDKMFTKGKLNNDSEIFYARGLAISKYRGVKEINHSGGWAEFSTYVSYFPEQHLSIVVLQNTSANATKAAHDIANFVLSGLEPLPGKSPEKETLNLPAKFRERYCGMYRIGTARYATITNGDTCLMIHGVGEDPVVFRALTDTSFSAYDSKFDFYTDEKGKVAGFNFRGVRCAKTAPVRTDLASLTGMYLSDEFDLRCEVKLVHDTLRVENMQNGSVTLTHAWKDEFIGSEWFMQRVEFYRDKNGKAEGFLVSIGRNRNQRFRKI
jgi:hypothetical protein